ncbi:uncharacterized protein ARMOST_22307 [Armillaria ostoyae]|uniref:Uncharacterized protein n=1 Tax=Armillaria ostoyae TaxID=47428 RepID=A0A284SCI4_ARMOS|nr:uncharacterized protein ARMOST_22307 [Armillaria ostoyae]
MAEKMKQEMQTTEKEITGEFGRRSRAKALESWVAALEKESTNLKNKVEEFVEEDIEDSKSTIGTLEGTSLTPWPSPGNGCTMSKTQTELLGIIDVVCVSHCSFAYRTISTSRLPCSSFKKVHLEMLPAASYAPDLPVTDILSSTTLSSTY